MDAKRRPPRHTSGCLKAFLISAVVVFILTWFFIYPVFKHGEEMAVASSGMQCLDTISKALFSYAGDHHGSYPDGKSSTEVFQKLLDEKYISDATTFYYPLPGKIRTTPDSKKLMPANVGFDVTYPIDDQVSGELPTVFLSGYKITYQAGAKAGPVKMRSSWSDWWESRYSPSFIIVCNKEYKVSYLRASADGSIPNFIPTDFDPKGKAYRQMTPDGELGP